MAPCMRHDHVVRTTAMNWGSSRLVVHLLTHSATAQNHSCNRGATGQKYSGVPPLLLPATITATCEIIGSAEIVGLDSAGLQHGRIRNGGWCRIFTFTNTTKSTEAVSTVYAAADCTGFLLESWWKVRFLTPYRQNSWRREQCSRQVYLLTPMDRATLPHATSPIPHCTPSEITRQQRYKRYFLKHIATHTVTCRLLAHTYTVRPKLHLVDLLSTYYTSKFSTNTRNRTDGAEP